jgi:Fic family protein
VYELETGERRRKFKTKYIPPYQSELLETIRFDYNYRLKNMYPSAFKMYKNAAYVKYVHGTTAIEGNTLNFEQTKQVLEDGIAVSGKSLREIHEVENYKRLRIFVENYNKRVDINFIKKLHEIVCANIPQCNPGSLRKTPGGIAGVERLVEISPPGAVEFDMEKLLSWFHNQIGKKYHILEIACQFHQRFEEVHPFVDGNGRVGRELINFFLETYGYPPIYLEKEDREIYLAALKAGNKDNPRPLIDLYLAKLLRNHAKFLNEIKELHLSNVEGVTNEPKEVQTRLSEFF